MSLCEREEIRVYLPGKLMLRHLQNHLQSTTTKTGSHRPSKGDWGIYKSHVTHYASPRGSDGCKYEILVSAVQLADGPSSYEDVQDLRLAGQTSSHKFPPQD